MNIEPLITRIKALNRVMNRFGSSEPRLLNLFTQSVQQLTPRLSAKDFDLVNDTISTQLEVIEMLCVVVEELTKDIETLEAEAKNEQ